ncbi:MAG: hypothetical protein IJY05_00840 [Clostridia bacterium]|nr:hypothetical protein [Clostridia bacterium]
MNRKKTIFRMLCCCLAGLTAFAFSSCSLLDKLMGTSDSEATQNGGSGQEKPEDFDSEISVDNPVLPDGATSEPNAEKVVEREETDSIGHKVVYYTDGTYEDLGRVEPLNFVSPLPTSQYSYAAFEKEENGVGLRAFYTKMYNAITQAHLAKTDYTLSDNDEYECVEISYKDCGLTTKQAITVWKIFAQENPLFFWMDRKILYTDKTLFCLVAEEYATYAAREKVLNALYGMAFECDAYLSGKTSLTERALTIYDYLCGRIEYAYKADGKTPEDAIWAHSIAGGALYNAGVCETYAETFDYFCGLFGLDCLTVTGTAMQNGVSEGHAWNILELDGEWYAMDLTWSDQNTYTREWFGKTASAFATSHIADTPKEWGTAYQYNLPALSSTGLCPVRCGEENGEYEMEKSLESAFEKMTNQQGRYEIILYPDTKYTSQNSVEISLSGGYFAGATPSVAHLQITGKKVKVGVLSYYLAKLSAGEVTLGSNVTLRYVDFDYTKLNKNGYAFNGI